MPKYDKNQYSLKQVYRFYVEGVDDPVSYKEHKAILDLWGSKVNDALLSGKDVKLHNGLSVLCIRKYIKKTYVNKALSKKKGELVKSPNVHSSFYGASVRWRRHYTRFNSAGWSFYPSKKLKKGLNKVMTANMGHTRFVKKATATSKQEQARSIYVKKVIKV